MFFFFIELNYLNTNNSYNKMIGPKLFLNLTFLLFLESVIYYLILIICVLLMVAFFTLSERKVMGAMQRRIGPNVVGFWGFLQPIADGMKVLFKEIIIPTAANKNLFIFAPYLSFVLSLLGWLIIPLFPSHNHLALTALFNYDTHFLQLYFPQFFDAYLLKSLKQFTSMFFFFNIDVLFLFALSSLSVYGIIIAGWSSNSKYTFLGSLRSAAQMISYEVSLGFILVIISMVTGHIDFTSIMLKQNDVYFISILFPLFLIFFISMIAETNRAPFDLPEAEAELVSGYNTEYSAITFALFMLAEYSNMLIMSVLIVIFFFGGYINCFGFAPHGLFLFIKVFLFAFSFLWLRATLPRYRYDHLMDLGWKIFLPFTLGFLLFVLGCLVLFDIIPYNIF